MTASSNPRKRRTLSATSLDAAAPAKKPRAETDTQPAKAETGISLIPHAALLAELGPKHDVLVASVISSTKISKRVARALEQLRAKQDLTAHNNRNPVVFLHARPTDVCKMITIAETVKREVLAAGGTWYQYNCLYVLPPSEKRESKADEPIETADAEDAPSEDDEDDGFETLKSRDRLDAAIETRRPARPIMSLSIFLSRLPITELKTKDGITMQTNWVDPAVE